MNRTDVLAGVFNRLLLQPETELHKAFEAAPESKAFYAAVAEANAQGICLKQSPAVMAALSARQTFEAMLVAEHIQ